MSKEQVERIKVLKSKDALTEYERIELHVLSNKIKDKETFLNKPSFSIHCVEVGVKHPVK